MYLLSSPTRIAAPDYKYMYAHKHPSFVLFRPSDYPDEHLTDKLIQLTNKNVQFLLYIFK